MRCAFLILVFTMLAFTPLVAQQRRAFSTEVLRDPGAHQRVFEQTMMYGEVPVYEPVDRPNAVLLENGYARYQFRNPDEWPLQGENVRPVQVTVIFTKYPKDKDFWLTDYHCLLARRLDALFSLDSALNDTSIVYRMILQTDCDNEFETQQLFHGIEITYVPVNSPTGNGIYIAEHPFKSETSKRPPTSAIKKVNQFMAHEGYTMDSTVYRCLDRNPQWPSFGMVVDWTGSMAGPGSEAILWHLEHPNETATRYISFFNDGNAQRNRSKTIGMTGGIYQVRADHPDQIIRQMRKARAKGHGGDSPENDIEALLMTLVDHPEIPELVLIADNESCIRDYMLLANVNRPVHIILLNTKNGINPQYLNLAWRTGGSIHTETLDLDSIGHRLQKNALNINGIHYRIGSDQQISTSRRMDNHFSHCDRYTHPARNSRKKEKRKKRRKEPECYFKT